MTESPLGDLLVDVQPGFATGDNLDDGVFQIRMNNLTRDGELVLEERRRVAPSDKQLEKCSLREGDVLFNATNSPELVGKTAFFPGCDEPAVYSNHFLRLRTRTSRLDPKYLARWLRRRFHQGYFSAKSKQWSNQATFGADRLVELKIPLPPIEEQRRIAAVLDVADELRAKRREALAKLDTLAEAAFAQVQATASASEPVPLGELAERVTVGHVGPASDCFVEQGVPFIRTGDILRGRLDLSAPRFVSESFHSANQKSRLQPGDVVITRVVSSDLRAAVVPASLGEANCSDVVVVRPGSRLEGAYLVGLLHQSRSQSELLGRRVGSSHQKVNTKVLQNWEIQLPPAAALARLRGQLEAIASVRGQYESSLWRLNELFASLQQRAFRGEL